MDLELQLRAAEARKYDLERAHTEALQALRGCSADLLEARQSRVRELEKKVALETVRCEELQLELAASHRNRSQGGNISSQSWGGKGTEIDKIMAKIEQDNRILAELDHSRSTTLGLATSASSHALGESSPPISPITMSHTTPSIYPTSNFSQNAYQPTQSHQLGYISSTNSYGVPISQQYNSLGHSYTSKSILGNINSMGQHPIGQNLGQTSLGQATLGQSGLGQNILGTSLGHQGLGNATLGTTVLGQPGLGTSGIANMPSSVFTTNSMVNSTFTNPMVTNNPASMNQTGYNNPNFSSTGTSSLNQYNLPYNPVSTSGYTSNVTFSNPLTSQYNNLPLTGSVGMSIKLKPLEEVELGAGRRAATPCTPHQTSWVMPQSLGMTEGRQRMISDGIESDWSGLHAVDRSYINGHPGEGQVDMLDIPGKGRCSVYIARFSYDPEPDTEEELNVQAGDYLLVWGEPVGGYLDAELLDGRRGLVPAHFAQRLIGDDLLEFHQAVLSTLREEEISAETFAADVQRLNELAEMSEGHEDDVNDGEQVPAPRQLTLERQLNKSVLISWTAPDVGPGNHIESYHVYVDGVLKTTIKATERTRALVEGVDSNRPHRISVRSVTTNRRTSRDAACTMIIGKDTHQLGPSAVRASNITSTQAVISWLPANSNHQHVVCVNNVEVRTVKPGVYRHTITGLAPNTQYRVTVRAKHHRAAQNIANLAEDLPMPAAAHTDFRTLPKGLPDPPSDILVEAGPQDGTLLVTWHPVITPHHPGSSITGYAVYADGKKVTDVDSPTGDHALIDITKLLGLNPKHVTVRTKARDSQSADSVPTPIPFTVLRGGANKQRQQPHSAVLPPHMRQQTPRIQQNMQQSQQIIEHDENLSDKEIFPSSTHRQQVGIPSIEITKDNYEGNLSEDEMIDRRNQRQQGQQYHRQHQQQQRQNQQQRQENQQQQYYQAQQNQRGPVSMRGGPQQQGNRGNMMGQGPQNPNNLPTAQKRARSFMAIFDYDPATMSPNPDACEEELAFNEGDTIKVWGDKDADGFYWGELRGRRGYVPHNMVMEIDQNQLVRDRWGDIYNNSPMRKMIALYDYDPQELSPNVDAEVELSFATGQIINVYGEMDDDGFYVAEIDGVRGLVPSNFLTDAPDQYGGVGQTSQQGVSMVRGQRGRGHGPGARGPPPPPRENTGRTRKTDACPVVPSQLDNATNTATPNYTQVFTDQQGREKQLRRGNITQQQQQQMAQNTTLNQPNPQQQFGQQNQFSQQQQNQFNQQQQNQFNQQQQNQFNQQQNHQFNQQQAQQGQFGQNAAFTGAPSAQQHFGMGATSSTNRLQQKGVPQVIPNMSAINQNMQMNQQQQQQQPGGPNLMQKLNEITAPGGDILSKGKELIFMKFGLGGK